MSADRQDIDLALATLERINDRMACGRIGVTSRPTDEGTEWRLDPRVEELGWVARWWRQHRDEDISMDEFLELVSRRARRTVETVLLGLLAVEQLGREHRDEAARLEERMTTLLDLIKLRGKLLVRMGTNRTVNWWLVFGAIVGVAVGFMHMQALPLLLVPGSAVIVAKVVLLDWPIRRWRSRIAEMEQARCLPAPAGSGA